MLRSFSFNNLLGSVYREGDIIFLQDGDTLLSPVGTRITRFDFKRNCSKTFPFESIKNIQKIAVSPDESLMIVVDKDGKALLVSLLKSAVLHHFNFKRQVRDIKYSPCGRFVATTHERAVQVWLAPKNAMEFSPFVLHDTLSGHHDDTVCLDWSCDSRFVVVGSKDMTARIFSVEKIPGFHSVTLSGHRRSILACFFQKQSLNVYTVARDCAVYIWHCRLTLYQLNQVTKQALNDPRVPTKDGFDVSPAKWAKHHDCVWELANRHLFLQKNTTISCAQLHCSRDLLVLGFANGVFSLHEMPDFHLIHSLSISNQTVTSICINKSGEWLALGCASLGQLVVWEWQSESFVLKQQGHYYDMNVVAFSPDGQWITTGGDGGKVKLWDTVSGFCFVTFHKHTAAVTGVTFGNSGQFVLSSSLDGTVRAFDLNRYRNFRTFTSAHPVQFSCIGVNKSSDMVCAGSQDTFEVFVWSVQSGRLLEVLSGHQGPVSSLAISASSGIIASSSWDKTVRVWDLLNTKGAVDVLTMTADALDVSFRPDGNEIAVATLDGNISLWHLDSLAEVGSIECQRDAAIGSHICAKQNYFTSVCYSSDGSCLLAGGRSKFVHLYNAREQALLKKFQLSKFPSMDVSREFESESYRSNDFGPFFLDEGNDTDSETCTLPKVLKGDISERHTSPEIRTKSLQFSPTGQCWAAATSEGLVIYTVDQELMFHPYDLSYDVTPNATRKALKYREFSRALAMSLMLNEAVLVKEVVEAIPLANAPIVADQLPLKQVDVFLEFIARQLGFSHHLEFYLCWCSVLLSKYAYSLKQRSSSTFSLFQTLQRNLSRHLNDLGPLSNDNSYLLQFLVSVGAC